LQRNIDEVKRGTRIDLRENWRNPLGFALPSKDTVCRCKKGNWTAGFNCI